MPLFLQLAQFVVLSPRRSVGVGVVHGDGTLRMVFLVSRPLIPALYLELELGEAGAHDVGVAGMRHFAWHQQEPVEARCTDTAGQGSRHGEFARAVAGFEVLRTVVVGLYLGAGSAVGDGVRDVAGIGSLCGNAGDAKGILLTENFLRLEIDDFVQMDVAVVGRHIHKVNRRGGHSRCLGGRHGDAEETLAVSSDPVSIMVEEAFFVQNRNRHYRAEIHLNVSVGRHGGRSGVVGHGACLLVELITSRLGGLAAIERHAEAVHKVAHEGTLHHSPVIHRGGDGHRLAALVAGLV